MTRMVDWSFIARRPDSSEQVVMFYAPTKREALTLARAWAKRMGYEIEPVEEGEATALAKRMRARLTAYYPDNEEPDEAA